MKYPEILFLPILMLSDYFLTVFGAVQKAKKHDEHFKAQHYELNPVWQESIKRKRWFNPRHLLITFGCSGLLSCLLEFGDMPESLAQVLFGCLFTVFGTLNGRHLANILVFRRLSRSRAEISGRVAMTHSLTLAISTYQYLVVAVPVIIIGVFSPGPFVMGAVLGITLLFVAHFGWIQRHRKKLRLAQKAADAGLTVSLLALALLGGGCGAGRPAENSGTGAHERWITNTVEDATIQPGDRARDGGLVIHVFDGPRGLRFPVRVYDDYGFMVHNVGDEQRPQAEFELALNSQSRVVTCSNIAAFQNALSALPKGSALYQYDKCGASSAWGLDRDKIFGELESFCRARGITVTNADFVTCTCVLEGG